MQRPVLAAILTALLWVLSCGTETPRPNVLIIGVDTLRPDHLGCYGYARPTSRNIDRLATDGILCENASSQAPWTLPSFATVFTSLYPTQHGAVRLGNGLRGSFPTLAEILKANGYATGAIINAPTLKPATRVSRGFDYYHTLPLGERVADGTTRDVLTWMDTVGDQPFFMFAHYFDPHLPYSPPAPYHGMYGADYEGSIGESFNLEGFSPVKSVMCEEMRMLSAEDWEHIISLYDGEITFADQEIGNLLNGLESRGLRGRTLVVFLSDHGEEFYDHYCFGHGHSLYNELIKVPLVFSMPGTLPEGVRIGRQVRLVDVAPTILDLIDVEPDGGFEGVSLKPLLEGEGNPSNRGGNTLSDDVAFAESISEGPEQKCIIRYPWKLVYNMLTEQEQLFRLDEDPYEKHDLAPEEPQQVASMEGILFPTLFGLSETWSVELAGGSEGHKVDLSVKVQRGLSIGRIHPCKLLDQAGRIVDATQYITAKASGSITRLSVPELQGTYTLVFQVNPAEWPVEFDIQIDGRSALDRVHLGKGLTRPKEMPVSFGRRRGSVISPERPAGNPDPPYVMIWLAENKFGGEIRVEHDEQTKKEFRALGYIQ